MAFPVTMSEQFKQLIIMYSEKVHLFSLYKQIKIPSQTKCAINIATN